jgi:hypothetical protein
MGFSWQSAPFPIRLRTGSQQRGNMTNARIVAQLFVSIALFSVAHSKPGLAQRPTVTRAQDGCIYQYIQNNKTPIPGARHAAIPGLRSVAVFTAKSGTYHAGDVAFLFESNGAFIVALNGSGPFWTRGSLPKKTIALGIEYAPNFYHDCIYRGQKAARNPRP